MGSFTDAFYLSLIWDLIEIPTERERTINFVYPAFTKHCCKLRVRSRDQSIIRFSEAKSQPACVQNIIGRSSLSVFEEKSFHIARGVLSAGTALAIIYAIRKERKMHLTGNRLHRLSSSPDKLHKGTTTKYIHASHDKTKEAVH